MDNLVQKLAAKINMPLNEFIGEMRKRGCSEPTAIKIWSGTCEQLMNSKIMIFASAAFGKPLMFYK